ncbi:MAG: hypothetical protein AB7P20_21305 [Rhizobiaceae bacterium]
MDGSVAIERNQEALKRILAALVAMAGFAFRGHFSFFPHASAVKLHDLSAESDKPSPAPILPCHLYRAMLSLLRPAEAAARRLIVALACDVVVVLSPSHSSKPRRAPAHNALRSLGIAVTMSPVDLGRAARAEQAAAVRVSRCNFNLPLLDPLRMSTRPRDRYVPTRTVPRIRAPGLASELPDSMRAARPSSADDPVDATRLGLRLQALAVALDDLPKQARRFACWLARRDRALERGKRHRIWPLKPGRPPGGRLARFDPTAKRRANIREVDEILAHAHALAVYALERHDSS